MTTKIKKLNALDLQEFVQLIQVFEDVFEMKNFMMPNEKHLQNLLAQENFMAFVALDENSKVVAGLTAYTLTQYYATKPLVYIFDLAVTKSRQRNGIGKALIAEINRYCKDSGMEEVFVQADAVDDYAVEFYRATGGIPESVFHFYYPLNKNDN